MSQKVVQNRPKTRYLALAAPRRPQGPPKGAQVTPKGSILDHFGGTFAPLGTTWDHISAIFAAFGGHFGIFWSQAAQQNDKFEKQRQKTSRGQQKIKKTVEHNTLAKEKAAAAAAAAASVKTK